MSETVSRQLNLNKVAFIADFQSSGEPQDLILTMLCHEICLNLPHS